MSVSYTHLDVYKRQQVSCIIYLHFFFKKVKFWSRVNVLWWQWWAAHKCQGLLSEGVLLLHDNAGHLLPPTLSKPLRNCISRFWSILHTDPILRCQIKDLSLVNLKMHWGAVNSPGTKKWRKWYIHRLLLSQNTFFWGHQDACAQWWTKCIEKQEDLSLIHI